MNEELASLDLELKGLFVEVKFDEIKSILRDRTDDEVKNIYSHSWDVIKKYYDDENFELLLKHIKFVAYSCFMVEYAHERGLISEEAFGLMMSIYKDINKSQIS